MKRSASTSNWIRTVCRSISTLSFRFPVLRQGFVEAGQEWMWGNWVVRWPIRRVSFAIERREGFKSVAVFRFLSEDWSPWIALVRMRERWPELRFEMKVGYLQMWE